MKRVATITLVMVVAAGCARPEARFFRAAEQRTVWPAEGEPARVEYLGEFAGEIRPRETMSAGAALRKALFGEESGVPHLVTPQAVAVDASGDRVAIADTNGGCVHVLSQSTEAYVRIEGASLGGKRLRCPVGVAWLGEKLYIADAEAAAILLVEPGRETSKQAASGGRWFGEGDLRRPSGLAGDAESSRLFVSDAGSHSIVVYDCDGRRLWQFGKRGPGPGEFNYPTHVAVDPAGNLVVSDSMNFRIQRMTAEGRSLAVFGRKGDATGDFALPKGVAADAAGNIWVVDAQFENVQAFDKEGRLLFVFGNEGRRPGEFWLPSGAAIDSRQRLWIADTYNRRVQVFALLQ